MLDRSGKATAGPCILTAALAIGAWCSPAAAQLTGGSVAAGKAIISNPSATSTLIQQLTPTAIINWNGYSIPRGASVVYQQPSASSIALNRVLGGSPSLIYGTLTANGRVWLINPAGIVVGKGANISVASVLLSTVDIHDADFLAGNYSFDIPGNAGAGILNRGSITAGSGGSVVLAGAHVTNEGMIAAALGTVVVAGASTYTVDFAGDGLLSFAVTGAATSGTGPLVNNKGTIAAPGGVVLLTAQAAKGVLDNVINTSGIIEATSAATVDGKIVLSAAGGGTTVSGLVDASGTGAGETGGTVEVLGDSVTVAAGAKIDVSGSAGGGTALVGGNFHGAGPLPNAATTTVAAGSIIDADALASGNGGQVAVWSENATTIAGSITARGGAAGGNGGYVETSGGSLTVAGASVSTAAPAGVAGTWLLDPYSVVIDAAFASTIDSALVNGGVVIETSASAATAYISSSGGTNPLTIPGGDVNSSGTGDITVAAPIAWSTGSGLILSAFRNININAPITASGSGTVALIADNSGDGVGTVVFGGSVAASGSVSTTASGETTIFYNPTSFPNQDSFPQISGTLNAFMLINNINNLQNIANNLAGDYALSADIDASATSSWNSGAGFLPIGPFAGELLGQGHTVNGLFIDSTTNDVGLFSSINSGATVANLNITNANVSASTGSADVGVLAGDNNGTISAVAVSGTLTATGDDGSDGGLVGNNYGNIVGSNAAVTVNGLFNIGGLVGENSDGMVYQSYATGNVTGTGENPYAGGLVGWQTGGTIMQSYAVGNVTTDPALDASGNAGGLVGTTDDGSISQSYALGQVDGIGANTTAGGLIGDNSINVDQVFSTGAVAVSTGGTAGPLIGSNSGASVTNAYWDSDSAGQPSNGVGTPITTAQLQSGLPSGFDSSVWSSSAAINGGLPFLTNVSAVGPGAPSGSSPSPPSPPSGQPSSQTTSSQMTQTAVTGQQQTSASTASQPLAPLEPSSPTTTTLTGTSAPPPAPSEPVTLPSGPANPNSTTLTSVTDLDSGSSLYNQIAGGGSPSSDPLTNIPPITPAPQPEPKPLLADAPLGGFGGNLFLQTNAPVASDNAFGVGGSPPLRGNDSLWFAVAER